LDEAGEGFGAPKNAVIELCRFCQSDERATLRVDTYLFAFGRFPSAPRASVVFRFKDILSANKNMQ
jgi:hypothetical protein